MFDSGLAASLALAMVLCAPAASGARAPLPADDSVWITVDADMVASAQRRLAPLPGLAGGVVLEKLDAHAGVVLTRLPAAAIDALAEIVHTEFRRCGGFIRHASRARAEAAMDRLREPRLLPLVLPFTIDQQAWVAALAGQVSEPAILSTITELSTAFPNRYHAHHAVHHSADWIRNLWLSLAAQRPDVTVDFFDHGGLTPQPSVILTIPGSSLPGEIVVLGGHQDSTRFGCSISSNPACVAPGADDDASGIAVLTEVIRVALANGFRPQRTVQFMAYAAEEVGLVGSEDIAATYDAQGKNVVAVLQQDMTAWEGSVQDIYVYTGNTDPELNAFVSDLVETYQPTLGWGSSTCGYACSDHASWWQFGYRASFAFESTFDQSNPYIHSINDTVASFGGSAVHAAKFARLAAAFMVETGLDGVVPPPMPFLDGFETADTSRWTVTIP